MLSHMLKQSYHPQYRGDPAVKSRDYVRNPMKPTPLHTPSSLKSPSPSHESSQSQSSTATSLISRTAPASNEFLNRPFCNAKISVQSDSFSPAISIGNDKKANTFENHDNPIIAPIPIEIPKQNSIFNYAWKISKDLEINTPSTSLESSSVGSTRMVCLKTKNKLIKTNTPSILPNNHKSDQFSNLKNKNTKNRPKFIIYESSDADNDSDSDNDDDDIVEKEKKHWNTPCENSDSEETLVDENSIYNLQDSLSFYKKCQKPKVKHSLDFELDQEEDSATEADCEDEIDD